ncbi:hypothetical protein SYNPS1DRAFT_22830 [Syncephalis pseudoplumigaleata]|uniref:DUF2423 domain-containing protein n=1 Tax=Syncephalis pseudoplumigaleata TaxID=1712513 RepID=A0A4V1J1I4_9FUNG|nr:hypothetical protein SYNPS1DRAFT_22830 [Syncephalis pseudoplumigaleata]|eukprot:RKP25169.1 hypothetical protein SYNPS1DRAFT_22830 [Syncephalis pseudoplumigaleata]
MAKSIRSKSKRRFRAIKRDSLFGKVEAERVARLAAKQSVLKEAEYVQEAKEEAASSMDVQGTEVAETAEAPMAGIKAAGNDDAAMQDAAKDAQNKKGKRAHMTKKQTQRRNKRWKKFFI